MPEQPRPRIVISVRLLWRKLSRSQRQLLGIWLALRLLSSCVAAVCSSSRPLTQQEQSIAIWPPSIPFNLWLERVLLAPWNRWDAAYYIRIVQHGYNANDGTALFHPLLPWLATPVALLGGQPLFALLIVSSLASMLLMLAFEHLARLDLNPAAARASTLLLFFSPIGYVLFAPYTEGLWLLCAVLCFLWARRRCWWLAGIAGALATLTRQQGLFLILPLAWELWEAADRNWRNALIAWRNWLALGLIPGGYVIWLVYRAAALNDLHVNFNNPQSLIYSLMISPSADKVVPVQSFVWPWQALWRALTIYWRAPHIDILIDLSLGALFLVLFVFAWRHLRISYRIFAATMTLLAFSFYTGPVYPYMGLPRHLLLAFPVFIGLGSVHRYTWLRWLMLAIGLIGWITLLMFHTLHGWVP